MITNTVDPRVKTARAVLDKFDDLSAPATGNELSDFHTALRELLDYVDTDRSLGEDALLTHKELVVLSDVGRRVRDADELPLDLSQFAVTTVFRTAVDKIDAALAASVYSED